jgi:hypothetical protein
VTTPVPLTRSWRSMILLLPSTKNVCSMQSENQGMDGSNEDIGVGDLDEGVVIVLGILVELGGPVPAFLLVRGSWETHWTRYEGSHWEKCWGQYS